MPGLAKWVVELSGWPAVALIVALLILAVGMFGLFRYLERSRDTFSSLLEREETDGEPDGREWNTEYTSPTLFGVAQFGARFDSCETPDGLYLEKTRSLTGASRLGTVYLPSSSYTVSRSLGGLVIERIQFTEENS